MKPINNHNGTLSEKDLFINKGIPILIGEHAKRFIEMAEKNEVEYKNRKPKQYSDVKKVIEKQQKYLMEKPEISNFKLNVYTKEELKTKKSKVWKPIA